MDIRKIRERLLAGESLYSLPLRVAYYARVSTDKYEQMSSLDNQISYFDSMIQKNHSWTFAGGYVDEGLSGTSVSKRQKFLNMISDAKAGRFDLIVTKEISRFSRNTLDSIRYTQELIQCGVGVFFQSDNINTLLPDSELRLTIMAGIAQDEVRKLSERVRFGFSQSIAQGRVLGAPPYGYEKKDGILHINAEQAAVVRQIFTLYATGSMGLRQISNHLAANGIVNKNGKPFTYPTLKGILTNPKYKGYYCGRKYASADFKYGKKQRLEQTEWVVYRDNSIPVIVDEMLWEQANGILSKRSTSLRETGRAAANRYFYSGRIVCAAHNTGYHRQMYGGKEVWNCKVYREKGRRQGCESPTVYSCELDAILESVVKTLHSHSKALYEAICARQQQFTQVEQDKQALFKLRRKKEMLLELVTGGFLEKTEFARQNQAANEAICALEHKLEQHTFSRLSQKQLSEQFLDWHTAGIEKILVSGSREDILLDVRLKLPGQIFLDNHFLSLQEIGISQAQVSRLEKSAMEHMKKYI